MWVAILTQVAIAIAAVAVSYLLMPKPKGANPAASETLDIPTAREGATIPVLFGTKEIRGANVTWYGDVSTSKIRK